MRNPTGAPFRPLGLCHRLDGAGRQGLAGAEGRRIASKG
ncbi:hypothetical protein SFOMI_0824 [Sphingobium fuliginis]|uniref:Uncharacterized protein n=1 Tax=Sphingobium fuliginis (strain ATCC 27551) TaxID=336203 RepID=A0A292ZBP5_SPHSA|nr:hypothetical protein SFOMI_0824 [Sphingobium fuliginis]